MTGKRLVVGFDGFVDSITKPILRTAAGGAPAEFYPDIASLGRALQQQGGKSCSIELEMQEKRPGGNAPLLASGAAALGMQVACIGMLGEGEPLAHFREKLSATLYAYAAPGESIALEFSDGKVFLAPGVALSKPAWQLIQEATEGKAAGIIAGADALAIVNWSELSFAQDLWQDVLEHALLPAEADKERTALFDLCDCTRRSTAEIEAVLRLMGRYSARRTTLLSLNQNEAAVVAARLLPGGEGMAFGTAAEGLREAYNIDEVLVHAREGNWLATARGTSALENDIIDAPVISTGAGDHFNAALCWASAEGLPDAQRLRAAQSFVRGYLKNGRAPTLDEIKESL